MARSKLLSTVMTLLVAAVFYLTSYTMDIARFQRTELTEDVKGGEFAVELVLDGMVRNPRRRHPEPSRNQFMATTPIPSPPMNTASASAVEPTPPPRTPPTGKVTEPVPKAPAISSKQPAGILPAVTPLAAKPTPTTPTATTPTATTPTARKAPAAKIPASRKIKTNARDTPKPASNPSSPVDCPKLLKQLLSKLGSTTAADGSDKSSVPKSVATLVTAYYSVPSRHPPQHYMQWFKLFLLKIRTPIAFYTNCETLTAGADIIAILLERERMFPGRLLVHTMELEDPPLAKRFASVMKRQEALDPERSIGHNYRLSMIWLMKTEAMMATIRENHYSSEWFMWVDSGAFRTEHRMKDWPSPERLALLPKDRVFYELVLPFPNENQVKGISPTSADFGSWVQNSKQLYYGDHLAAGFIGLHTKDDFHLKFYKTLTSVYQLMADRNLLIVKEQNVFNLMFLMYPQMFATIRSSWACGDKWFHVEPWLASQQEYPCNGLAPLFMIT